MACDVQVVGAFNFGWSFLTFWKSFLFNRPFGPFFFWHERTYTHIHIVGVYMCVCLVCVCVCACIRDSVANVCCFIQRVLLTDWLYHDHSRRQVSVPVVSCLRIHDDVNKPPLAIRPLSHKQPVRHPDWNISTDSQGKNCFQFDRKSLLCIVYLLNFNLISRKA